MTSSFPAVYSLLNTTATNTENKTNDEDEDEDEYEVDFVRISLSVCSYSTCLIMLAARLRLTIGTSSRITCIPGSINSILSYLS